MSAAIRFADDIVKLGVTYNDHNRTGFSAPHFGQIPPPCSDKPARERQSTHAMGIRTPAKTLMPSPTHFRYAISSTNAAAVAQKKPAARPSQTPGASEPLGAGWAHAALYRELHCRHFIRLNSRLALGRKGHVIMLSRYRTADVSPRGPQRTSRRLPTREKWLFWRIECQLSSRINCVFRVAYPARRNRNSFVPASDWRSRTRTGRGR